jgi:uncharacterized membrane protein YidH (DUF202 family)
MGYALHRTAIGLLVFGFSMMSGLIALHFWGPIAGSLFAASGPAILATRVACQIRSGESLKSSLTSRCDVGWQLHPALTLACGAAFVAAGIWIIAMVTDGPGLDEKQMTAAERSWFGAIFVLLGSGVFLLAISSWLVRFSRHA